VYSGDFLVSASAFLPAAFNNAPYSDKACTLNVVGVPVGLIDCSELV
jgi:hypothetical protein